MGNEDDLWSEIGINSRPGRESRPFTRPENNPTEQKERLIQLTRAYIEEYKLLYEQIIAIKSEQVTKVDFRGVETKSPPIPEELIKKEQEIFVYFASHTKELKSAGLNDILLEFVNLRS